MCVRITPYHTISRQTNSLSQWGFLGIPLKWSMTISIDSFNPGNMNILFVVLLPSVLNKRFPCMRPWMWNSWLCFQFWRKPLLSLYLQGHSSACTHYISHDLDNSAKQGHTVFSPKLVPNLVKENQKKFPFTGSPSFIVVSMWGPPLEYFDASYIERKLLWIFWTSAKYLIDALANKFQGTQGFNAFRFFQSITK